MVVCAKIDPPFFLPKRTPARVVGWVEGGAPEPIYCKNRARNPTSWGMWMLGFGEKIVFRIEMLFTLQPNLRVSSYHNSPDGRPPRFWKPRRSILFAISIVRAKHPGLGICEDHSSFPRILRPLYRITLSNFICDNILLWDFPFFLVRTGARLIMG